MDTGDILKKLSYEAREDREIVFSRVPDSAVQLKSFVTLGTVRNLFQTQEDKKLFSTSSC